MIFRRSGPRPVVGGGPFRQAPALVDPQPPKRPVREATSVTIRPAPPRLARDKVLMLLSDGCYHAAHEISKLEGLGPGEWYVSLQELIEHGYMFGRRGNTLVLLLERNHDTKRPAQDLAELLAGIDATKPDVGSAYKPSERPADDRPVVGMYEGAPRAEVPRAAVLEDDQLRIGDVDMQLSAKEYITSTRAILARKSSGKTYLAKVIVEEILRVERLTGTAMPFVAFDPTGVWYGLCANVEGQPSTYQILRLGGRHGDFDLRFEEGGAVAEMVVKLWPTSVILDVSDMLPEEQHQFFGDFGNKLYTLNDKPIHLFVDEADDFMPQSVEAGNKAQRRALGVGDRIVRRARVKGIGVTLITQRPAVISKNVLSQVDGVFFLSVTAPHDLEAIESWMRPAVVDQDRRLALEALPTLDRGEAFFVQAHKKSGAIMKFRTRTSFTFDSSRTPSVDDPEPPVPSLSKVSEDVWRRVGGLLGKGQNMADLAAEERNSGKEDIVGDDVFSNKSYGSPKVGDDGREED